MYLLILDATNRTGNLFILLLNHIEICVIFYFCVFFVALSVLSFALSLLLLLLLLMIFPFNCPFLISTFSVLLYALSTTVCAYACFVFQLAGINEEYQSIMFQKSTKQDMLSIQEIMLDTLVDEAKSLNFKLLNMTEL